MPITIARAVISTSVSRTLNFTLSPTPRRLIRASSTMNPRATAKVTAVVGSSLPKPISRFCGQQVRGRGRAGDARADHRERHQERDEVDAERLVRIERCTRGLRILRHQLQVREGRHRRDGEGHQEGQPRNATDLARDLAGDGVHPRSQDVAHDEEQEQLGPEDPFQVGILRTVDVRFCGRRTHRCAPVRRVDRPMVTRITRFRHYRVWSCRAIRSHLGSIQLGLTAWRSVWRSLTAGGYAPVCRRPSGP